MDDGDEIRPVAGDERRAVIDALRAALLNGPVSDENFEAHAASWDDSDSLAAWDGDRCVGTAGAFRFDSTVPGGSRVRTAGITRVGVLPTHTRRGLLTRMMHRLLTESRDRGNVLATLHASETAIYRRFGFGLGTDLVSARVRPADARPWRVPAATGSMRLLRHDEILDVVPPLYERIARWRVGSLSRPVWWWEHVLRDAVRTVDTMRSKGVFVAVHTDDEGVDDGYVYYEVEWDESFGTNPVGQGAVHDLWGTSPRVEVELWRFLVDVDLVIEWRAEERPVDEPVRRAMHDARAYETPLRIDDQWIRILDVDAALTARSYNPVDGAVTIAVDDPMFTDNASSWQVSATGAARTGGDADVAVDIAALSAAYLGAVSWHDLAATGAVTASTAELDRLDTLFAVHPTPFCGTGY